MKTVFATKGEITRQLTLTASKTLSTSDAEKDINIATDALVLTLPLITENLIGMSYLVRNTGADGGNLVKISPNALDSINGTIANAAEDSVAGGVVNKDFVNTKATSNNGDWVELVAVALTKWYIKGGVGICASEA
jgi:Iap family predicted aminopeptidase